MTRSLPKRPNAPPLYARIPRGWIILAMAIGAWLAVYGGGTLIADGLAHMAGRGL